MPNTRVSFEYKPIVPIRSDLDIAHALTALYGRSYEYRRMESSNGTSYFVFDRRSPTSIMPGLGGDWVAEIFPLWSVFRLRIYDSSSEVPINSINLDRKLIAMEQQRRLSFLTPLR